MNETDANLPQDSFEENNKKGWVKLYRSVFDSHLEGDGITLAVWFFILGRADHAERWSGGKQIRKPGEFRCTVKFIQKGLGFSRKQVRRALGRLAEGQSVAIKTTNKKTIIQVLNWDTYQSKNNDEGQQKGQQRANKGPTKGQQRATIQECKNGKMQECKNGGVTRARAYDLPPLEFKTWQAYSEAYEKNYGIAPVMNPKQRRHVRTLVSLLADTAPAVIAYYVNTNHEFYLKRAHTLDIAITDAEKLYTAFLQESGI